MWLSKFQWNKIDKQSRNDERNENHFLVQLIELAWKEGRKIFSISSSVSLKVEEKDRRDFSSRELCHHGATILQLRYQLFIIQTPLPSKDKYKPTSSSEESILFFFSSFSPKKKALPVLANPSCHNHQRCH